MPSILIVEDSSAQAAMMAFFLGKHGYKILSAENGKQGLAEAERHKPDLILMDVVMPVMDGFEATRLLARNPVTQHIPVIMITSKGEEEYREKGLKYGAHEYLVKPVPEDVLIGKIRQYLVASKS